MQINICIHTQRVCTSYPATRMCTSLMFLAQLQTFPISLKTWSLQVCQVAERWGQSSAAPNLSNTFNVFLIKRMKRYSLIKKKSCLCLLFTILLSCPPKIKLFLKHADLSNISPFLPSSELCNFSAALKTDWRGTSDTQMTLSCSIYFKSIFYFVWHKKIQPEAFYYTTTSKLYTSHL